MEELAAHRSFGGWQRRFRHHAESLQCAMSFSVYLPPQAEHGPVPVLFWLSGLTCTDENFATKAGAQQHAAQAGLAIVVPDTSPRGEAVADDPQGAYDLGLGAGFYLNAERAPWLPHYRMYDYVVDELPALLAAKFPLALDRAAIAGHSMGGHGALVVALRNPGRFRSMSAFAPICNPTACPWGEKAFTAYLGPDRSRWAEWDASLLLARAGEHLPLLVDQGLADGFLTEQLRPEALEAAGRAAGYPMAVRRQAGYDHSYYFIASFIGDHIRFHAEHLGVGAR